MGTDGEAVWSGTLGGIWTSTHLGTMTTSLVQQGGMGESRSTGAHTGSQIQGSQAAAKRRSSGKPHGKARNSGSGANSVKCVEAAKLIQDLSDRLPYRCVRQSSMKVWIGFEKKIKKCRAAKDVAAQARWLFKQIKQDILKPEWRQDGSKSTAWLQKCEKCNDRMCLDLVRIVDNEAIDWDAVMQNWALERGPLTFEPALYPNMDGGGNGGGGDDDDDDDDDDFPSTGPGGVDLATPSLVGSSLVWPRRNGVTIVTHAGRNSFALRFRLGLPRTGGGRGSGTSLAGHAGYPNRAHGDVRGPGLVEMDHAAVHSGVHSAANSVAQISERMGRDMMAMEPRGEGAAEWGNVVGPGAASPLHSASPSNPGRGGRAMAGSMNADAFGNGGLQTQRRDLSSDVFAPPLPGLAFGGDSWGTPDSVAQGVVGVAEPLVSDELVHDSFEENLSDLLFNSVCKVPLLGSGAGKIGQGV